MTTSPVEPRMAHFRRIRHPKTGQVLDRGLILWFPGPRSFTGEDSVELQIHGGNAVVKGVLEALREIEDFRMAEQGEFARRAFDNNKLDLTELEGLADLLNAETELQRKLALQQAEGGLRVPYEKWRQEIIHCMAKTEAVIDFGEDENIEEGVMDEVIRDVRQLYTSISKHLDDSHIGEIVRSGIHVAIMGPPNAGKSTLLNRLTKREAAIVSNIPGTTRDIVEVKLDLAGFPVVLCDTAGLRESSDVIEMEGIKRAKARIDISDIKICMLSAEQGESIDPMVEQLIDDNTYVILNKEDAVSQQELLDLSERIRAKVKSKNIWTMSCKTGLGVDRFLAELLNVLKSRFDSALDNPVLITQARHREHLEECARSLKAFLDMPTEELVLSAEELRLAANALGRVTGRIDVEKVLDVLFGQFCIGK
ncbi:hypothetical protein G6F70_003579 [Rhizopus microsporus]|nr:hypothetical protein G6F71_002054 [Rhizopus microsporus]KAG1200950.1 hypothetical protein G6F70_003579 [Rhizopus microsporus]KAG1212781.1 hypothetical protein G6F69_003386 [Rhizopus microsporus]KAG1236401.1 hypothetical protein G6F67_002004 [Rhizopus microsporus]KAG1268280.1 hypothetical protein G6F68_001249 [Rhizopus microsporus]